MPQWTLQDRLGTKKLFEGRLLSSIKAKMMFQLEIFVLGERQLKSLMLGEPSSMIRIYKEKLRQFIDITGKRNSPTMFDDCILAYVCMYVCRNKR